MFSTTNMDVIIPVAPKDYPKLTGCIDGIVRSSLTPIRHVYIVARRESEPPHLRQVAGRPVFWIDEASYPFTIDHIAQLLARKGSIHHHASWYYQQLLKLYVYRVIPDLLDRVLILDADCHFAQRLPFSTRDGKAILASGYPFEWLLDTREYPRQVTHVHAQHARRLVPGWSPQSCFSGMQHHILLDEDIVEELLAGVEQRCGQAFWEVFIDSVDVTRWNAASEYVLYHHYALWKHPERVEIRHLTSCDIICDADEGFDALAAMSALRDTGAYQVVGCHAFLDLRKRLQSMDYIPEGLKRTLAASRAAAFLLVLHDGVLRLQEYTAQAPRQAVDGRLAEDATEAV